MKNTPHFTMDIFSIKIRYLAKKIFYAKKARRRVKSLRRTFSQFKLFVLCNCLLQSKCLNNGKAMSKRFAGLGRELLYTSASCVVASSVSFASAQVRKLTHAAASPFPTKLCFAGTPEQADFALCANPDFVRGRTKSACPAAAKSVCLLFHPAPFSVSGKQRYNTLDFPEKVVCHETAGFFGFFRSKGKLSPLNTPGKGERRSPLYTPGQQSCSHPYWMTQGQRCFPFGIPLMFRQWLSILKICPCLCPARTLKTGTENRYYESVSPCLFCFI